MSVLLLISQQAIHHQSHHVMSQYGEGTGGKWGWCFLSLGHRMLIINATERRSQMGWDNWWKVPPSRRVSTHPAGTRQGGVLSPADPCLDPMLWPRPTGLLIAFVCIYHILCFLPVASTELPWRGRSQLPQGTCSRGRWVVLRCTNSPQIHPLVPETFQIGTKCIVQQHNYFLSFQSIMSPMQ